MSQQKFHSIQGSTIRFEVLPEEGQTVDIADVDEVGQELVDELRLNHYSVDPAYTGKKGGPAYDILIQIPQFIHENREILLAMFDSISLTLQCLLLARDRRAEREKERRAPLVFTLDVNGKPITITAQNAESGAKLLESFQQAQPEEAKKVTVASNVKLKARVPRKRHRHSHT
jgi:hypothetical protein